MQLISELRQTGNQWKKMKLQFLCVCIVFANLNCNIENNNENHKDIFLVNKIPNSKPLNFKKEVVQTIKSYTGVYSPLT